MPHPPTSHGSRYAWTRAFWLGKGRAPFAFRLLSLALLLVGVVIAVLTHVDSPFAVLIGFALVLVGQLAADRLRR